MTQQVPPTILQPNSGHPKLACTLVSTWISASKWTKNAQKSQTMQHRNLVKWYQLSFTLARQVSLRSRSRQSLIYTQPTHAGTKRLARPKSLLSWHKSWCWGTTRTNDQIWSPSALLTFCPPGPPLREYLRSTWADQRPPCPTSHVCLLALHERERSRKKWTIMNNYSKILFQGQVQLSRTSFGCPHM